MTAFERLFGRPCECAASAPGRINLIGEHTDYNGGFVLPTPIPQHTRVELAACDDRGVRVASANLGPEGAIEAYESGCETATGGWTDYVKGVTWALQRNGIALPGFDARFESTLPIGGGVSSSAALSVALQRALRSRFALHLDDLAIAHLAREAENDFVGARVGVMDPMASSLGRPGFALFIDTRTLRHEQVAIPASIELVVVDSGIQHRHASGEYNRRREECERAAALLGVRDLRDVEISELDRLAALPEPLGRRARHVVTENARVLEAVAALREHRLTRLGHLLDESHFSMRDDYEVSIEPIDRLAELLRAQNGVLGARLTGGGFGGAVIALAWRGRGSEAATRAAEQYREATGRVPRVLVPEVTAAPERIARPAHH